MLVKFVLGVRPCFYFSSSVVPAEFYLSYGTDTRIYQYLDSVLHPSNVESVILESDGLNCTTVLVYRLGDDILLGLPPFDPIPDDGLPF